MSMRAVTRIKCKEALKKVYSEQLTYHQACLKSGITVGTLKKYRQTEDGKEVEAKFENKYANTSIDDKQYKVEIIGDYPEWFDFECTSPYVSKDTQETIRIRCTRVDEESHNEKNFDLLVRPLERINL